MMRRLALIAGMWLGLLGVVQPLLACAVNPAMADCCPDDMGSPCDPGTDSPDPGRQSVSCCMTAPATASAVISVESRDTNLAPATGGHPVDQPAMPATEWPSPVVDDVSLALRPPNPPVPSDGTETYLRTRRLRL